MARIHRHSLAWMTATAIAAALIFLTIPRAQAEKAYVLPAPAVDASVAPQSTSEAIVLAGGCFWGVQGVFQHLKGVTSAVSGYAGGAPSAADYDRVSTGTTGHAESVRVTFDPRVVSVGKILQVYFSVAHDPTQLNRQGPDTGTQYRSTIFAADAQQAQISKAYIAQLGSARIFDAPIVTRVETGKAFFPAEAYHQDYLARHPNNRYIVINDQPKVANLQRLFPTLYRADPVLVAGAR